MLVEKLFDLTTWEARACVSGETKGWAAEWAELLSAVSCRGMRMVRPLPSWVRTQILGSCLVCLACLACSPAVEVRVLCIHMLRALLQHALFKQQLSLRRVWYELTKNTAFERV